jgi:hypothetical protein
MSARRASTGLPVKGLFGLVHSGVPSFFGHESTEPCRINLRSKALNCRMRFLRCRAEFRARE